MWAYIRLVTTSFSLLFLMNQAVAAQICFNEETDPFGNEQFEFSSRISNFDIPSRLVSFRDDLIVYVRSFDELHFVDLRNPSQEPASESVLVLDTSIQGIARIGSHLYASGVCGRVYLIDLRDPSDPTVVGRGNADGFDILAEMGELVISRDSIYEPDAYGCLHYVGERPRGHYKGLLDYTAFFELGEELLAYDVSDPANTRIIGSLNLGFDPTSVSFSDEYLFCGWDEYDHETGYVYGYSTHIFDISDPSEMRHVAELPKPYRFVIHKEWYMYCFGSMGLDIYYVREMHNPRMLSSNRDYSRRKWVARSGRRIVSVQESPQYALLEMRGPEVAEIQSGDAYEHLAWITEYERDGSRIAQRNNIFSIENPKEPTLEHSLSGCCNSDIMMMHENYCYTHTGYIHDLNRPQGETRVGWFNIFRYSRMFFKRDRSVYCLYRETSPHEQIGLRVVSIENPTEPAVTSDTTLLSGRSRAISAYAASGDTLYVVTSESGGQLLLVINIVDDSPDLVFVKPLDADTRIQDMYAWGGKIFLFGYWHPTGDPLVVIDPGLSYDIPIASLPLSSRPTNGNEIAGWGPYLAAETRDGTIDIIDATHPASPEIITGIEFCPPARSNLDFQDGILTSGRSSRIYVFEMVGRSAIVSNVVSGFETRLERASVHIEFNVREGSILGLARIMGRSGRESWVVEQRYFGEGVFAILDESGPMAGKSDVEYSLQVLAESGEWRTIRRSSCRIPGMPSDSTSIRIAPNPFNPQTNIQISTHQQERFTIGIYDLAGRRVRDLGMHELPDGEHQFMWDGQTDSGRSAPAGAYFVRAETLSRIYHKKILLIK